MVSDDDGVFTRPVLYEKILGRTLSSRTRGVIYWYAQRHRGGRDLQLCRAINKGEISLHLIMTDHASWKAGQGTRKLAGAVA